MHQLTEAYGSHTRSVMPILLKFCIESVGFLIYCISTNAQLQNGSRS